MISKVESATLVGMDAARVHVEVSLAKGLPTLSIVGLPDAAVREAKDRVVAAIRNSGFEFPSKRLTINLAPAELRKEGAAFDLAIAIGILLASESISPTFWPKATWLGELALDGTIRPVRGLLAIARGLSKRFPASLVISSGNSDDICHLPNVTALPFTRLLDIVKWLQGEAPAPESAQKRPWQAKPSVATVDFSDIKGQAVAKRALEIAAAGGHNVMMIGCPGTGKSMLAQALPSILPAWTLEESLEASHVHSMVATTGHCGLLNQRPFRSPHHSSSPVSLIGGGDTPLPGEISLAHKGVLFLDELPEFRRDAIEALRQPLEEAVVHVQRARGRATFPAEFLLVGAMNPCPCGFRGHPKKECLCSEARIQKYVGRISGPILDRIDIQIALPVLKTDELFADGVAEPSEAVRKRVEAARGRQAARLQEAPTKSPLNARLRGPELRRFCHLDVPSQELLKMAVDRLGLSARAFDRLRRVARTIADLQGQDVLTAAHLAEALQYRAFDRVVQRP